MFNFDRRGPFEDLFTFQREFDRLFNTLWNDLSTRPAVSPAPNFQVQSTDDGWRIDVPIPGIDPAHVTLESAGSTVTVRAEVPAEATDAAPTRYEQTLTLPAFLDIERISAAYRHGMLRLTVPVKESVRPRRIEIEASGEGQKQLTGAAA